MGRRRSHGSRWARGPVNMNLGERRRMLAEVRYWTEFQLEYWVEESKWVDFMPPAPPPAWALWFCSLLAELFHQLQMYVLCRNGHNWVDAGSYGTPESGADHLRCTRCEIEWSHQYY